MCRLFGLHAGAEPVTATFWLLDAPDSLREQSHREPDGAGIGVFGGYVGVSVVGVPGSVVVVVVVTGSERAELRPDS